MTILINGKPIEVEIWTMGDCPKDSSSVVVVNYDGCWYEGFVTRTWRNYLRKAWNVIYINDGVVKYNLKDSIELFAGWFSMEIVNE